MNHTKVVVDSTYIPGWIYIYWPRSHRFDLDRIIEYAYLAIGNLSFSEE